MADGLRYRVAAGWCALLALTWPANAAEGPPKRGGTLTYLIPADLPPSFDGHREGTFAMVHATAPFYSTLIRIDRVNPSSTTDFVCDLCLVAVFMREADHPRGLSASSRLRFAAASTQPGWYGHLFSYLSSTAASNRS